MWYHDDVNELVSSLNSSREGISSHQAEERILKYGKNQLKEKKKKSFLQKFLLSLCDRMTIILLIAAAVSFITSYISKESFADPIIILIIVIANGIISVVQENRAEKALEALKKMISPETRVIRDGKTVNIPASMLVPGDVFLLEKGDIVPCDGRLLSSNELVTDESALTGESAGVKKDCLSLPPKNCPISEAANSVFQSSHVISGRAVVLAVKTGMSTCVGQIAQMLDSEKEQTPLQKRLAKLSVILGNVTIGICILIFIFSLIKGMEIGEMFMTSVSLSVAAIPEGLPAIVTVVLSAGVRIMAEKRAVVKSLPAVETLGCAQIICSDKTGTLTCNKMAVAQIYGKENELIKAFSLCNNDSSPTENALSEFVPNREEIRCEYPRVGEIPFDSVKKYMLTVHKNQNEYDVYIKGAPDIVSEYCKGFENEIARETSFMTVKGLRVMCFGKYHTKTLPKSPLDNNFDFLGLCGIYDPPRQEAAESVKICKKAGVRTIMITGDHPDTARAIAIELGITENDGMVITEKDLNSKTKREFERIIEKCNVFARVTPNFKLKIVSALKEKGYVVAMTGDGVNDAPALKKADIGCAMGISGTEVAKESADMILTDDNFSTIVTAVREGRGIYENIRRAVHFLLSCNIGELFTVFSAILMSIPNPLSPIQLLWVNLTTDSLPAIALGLEKSSEGLMEKPPIDPKTPLFSATRTARIILEGILIGTLAVSAFVIGNNMSGFLTGRTMCFLVLGISQLFHSLNLRSDESVFSKKVKKNPFVWIAFFFCILLQTGVVLIPNAAKLFGVATLLPIHWTYVFLLSAVSLAACEVYKKLK